MVLGASNTGAISGARTAGGFTLEVVHAKIAGRLRIRVGLLKRAADSSGALEDALSRLPDLTSIRANSRTGTVLIGYARHITHEAMLERVVAALGGQMPAVEAATDSLPHAERQTGGDPSADWHTLALHEVLARSATDAVSGLRPEEAATRLAAHGRNAVPEVAPTGSLKLLLRQVSSPPMGLLMTAAVASLFTGGILDAAVTLAVVAANAGLGYVTESGSERMIRRMTQRRYHAVSVVRDGREMAIDSTLIVPGDILVLKPDTIISADARLLATQALMVNESLLTGESEPVEKDHVAVCDLRTPLSARINMVYQGSFVASGKGRAVVVATGVRTEIGQIQQAAAEVGVPRTRLEKDLERIGGQLSVISLAICGTVFLAGYLRGRGAAEMLKSALALAVAAVPEGLPTAATTTLAIGLQELRRKKMLVRRLSAVEALGSVEAICFDKTGTLTENRMSLHAVHLGGEAVRLVHGKDRVAALDRPLLSRLFEIACLCSEVTTAPSVDGGGINGSETEAALVKAALQFGHDLNALRVKWPLVSMELRTASHRFMLSRHGSADGVQTVIAAKGDPVQILARCRRAMSKGGVIVELDDGMRRRISSESDKMAGEGLRVLGFAFAEEDEGPARDAGLVWVGAAALKDPIRPGVRELIRRLHGAGIRPLMITGDHSATARAIAEDIGLSPDGPLQVLDSTEFDTLPPDLLAALARRTHVFARVPPTKKLHIVRALQNIGLTVGMTGDGFNDAPALKAADIAIAVGVESASVARDVADVIVDGGEIGAIGDGIEQGRTIASNIRKSVHYMISTNISEIFVVLTETLSGDRAIESPLELLWLNLATDIFPALGLALEPPERDVMARPPRPSNEPLLRTSDLRHSLYESLVLSAGSLAAHAYGLSRYGPSPHTRTITFLSLVLSQLMHAWTCRYDRFEPLGGRTLFSNSRLNLALGSSLALQALPFLSPMLRRALGISALQPGDLAIAGATGLGTFAVNEALLAYRSRRGIGKNKQKLAERGDLRCETSS